MTEDPVGSVSEEHNHVGHRECREAHIDRTDLPIPRRIGSVLTAICGDLGSPTDRTRGGLRGRRGESRAAAGGLGVSSQGDTFG